MANWQYRKADEHVKRTCEIENREWMELSPLVLSNKEKRKVRATCIQIKLLKEKFSIVEFIVKSIILDLLYLLGLLLESYIDPFSFKKGCVNW